MTTATIPSPTDASLWKAVADAQEAHAFTEHVTAFLEFFNRQPTIPTLDVSYEIASTGEGDDEAAYVVIQPPEDTDGDPTILGQDISALIHDLDTDWLQFCEPGEIIVDGTVHAAVLPALLDRSHRTEAAALERLHVALNTTKETSR